MQKEAHNTDAYSASARLTYSCPLDLPSHAYTQSSPEKEGTALEKIIWHSKW